MRACAPRASCFSRSLSQALRASGDVGGARAAAGTVARLLPQVSECLPHSFWPVQLPDLQRFVREATRDGSEAPVWRGSLRVPRERLANFPADLRRCVPLHDPSCWNWPGASADAQLTDPQTSCLNCCDPEMRGKSWHKLCFDSVFTEERCCNQA
mmetsp:Transcript_23887/g.74390  ORF Transcript_23887/g.74390 Transcript_23887/m.74390 type:complete len:155 (+) Transcript_23887:799-1263(+)